MVLEMRMDNIELWVGELKKRGIKTFASKDLPEELRDRTMIIKAKYAGVITKYKRSNSRITWEIAE